MLSALQHMGLSRHGTYPMFAQILCIYNGWCFVGCFNKLLRTLEACLDIIECLCVAEL